MKSLEQTFTRDGFTFRLMQRAGDVALFEKRKPGHLRPSFETVIIQRHPAKSIMGREYPEREAMPSSESWGVAGWTQTDFESAHRKFNQLTQERGFLHTPSAVGAFGLSKGAQGGERLPQTGETL